MKTVVVANQKGGVGKSTVSRHLMFYGVDKGLRVLAVDMDLQGNFSTSLKNIAEANGVTLKPGLLASGLFDPANKDKPAPVGGKLEFVEVDEGVLDVERGDLEQVIKAGQKRFAELSKNYDVCVIDTGPSVSNLLIVALSVADFAVAPCKPDRDAIAGLARFFSNVVRVRDETGINPRLSPLGVLPNQIHPKRAYHRSVVDQMREAWGDGVLPVELYERAAIDVAKDRAVWQTDTGESRSLAAKEMKAVCAYIYKRMGI